MACRPPRDTGHGFGRFVSLDAEGGEAGYLLIAENGTPLRISPSAYRLLEAVDSGAGFDELAERLRDTRGRAVTADQIEDTYRSLVERLDRAATTTRRPPGFRWCWRLLPQSTVTRLASRLAVLYAPGVAGGFILAAVLAVTAVSDRGTALSWSAGAGAQAYVFFVISLLAHELGHSSACARFGVRPADIGVAIYLVFPAFYSDVTEAWRLRRRQRMVVDLGGIYFQLLTGAVYALAFRLTGWPVLRVAVGMIVVSCLVSLNPILRFDGYWLLADALGVTRLDREPMRLLSYLGERLRGRRSRACWPWPAGITAVLAVYTPLVIAGWCCLIYRTAPELWHRLSSYPGQAVGVIESLAMPTFPEIDAVWNLLTSTFLLVVSSLLIRRLFLCTAKLFCSSVLYAYEPANHAMAYRL